MHRVNIKEALDRVRSGKYSSEDETFVKYWIHQHHQDDEVPLSETEWLDIKHKIWLALNADRKIPKPTVKLWLRFMVTAAAVVAIVFGVWLYQKENLHSALDDKAVMNDIAPGKQGATLTLANGKKIRLTDAANGELANEAGVSITKSANGQLNYVISGTDSRDLSEGGMMNVLSTAMGETYMVTLPDKSKVWLNAATKLTYTARIMQGHTRTVKLEGEAYFEISKDKAHPFVVQTTNQEVEVLGTHFNINSYHDEAAVATTLLEGSVRVRHLGPETTSAQAGRDDVVLKPGDQALNDGNAIQVKKADIEKIIDWKNGEFNLDHQPFRTAMRKIARWYNVELVYDASVPDNIQSGGWISRDVKLQTILEGIERSGQAHFKLEGRKLYVSK